MKRKTQSAWVLLIVAIVVVSLGQRYFRISPRERMAKNMGLLVPECIVIKRCETEGGSTMVCLLLANNGECAAELDRLVVQLGLGPQHGKERLKHLAMTEKFIVRLLGTGPDVSLIQDVKAGVLNQPGNGASFVAVLRSDTNTWIFSQRL
jgi:hypothetical protein